MFCLNKKFSNILYIESLSHPDFPEKRFPDIYLNIVSNANMTDSTGFLSNGGLSILPLTQSKNPLRSTMEGMTPESPSPEQTIWT